MQRLRPPLPKPKPLIETSSQETWQPRTFKRRTKVGIEFCEIVYLLLREDTLADVAEAIAELERGVVRH